MDHLCNQSCLSVSIVPCLWQTGYKFSSSSSKFEVTLSYISLPHDSWNCWAFFMAVGITKWPKQSFVIVCVVNNTNWDKFITSVYTKSRYQINLIFMQWFPETWKLFQWVLKCEMVERSWTRVLVWLFKELELMVGHGIFTVRSNVIEDPSLCVVFICEM
jgi:hypothetical protein